MPQQLSAIDNAGSYSCVLSVKGSEGHLLYSMDVRCNRSRLAAKVWWVVKCFCSLSVDYHLGAKLTCSK